MSKIFSNWGYLSTVNNKGTHGNARTIRFTCCKLSKSCKTTYLTNHHIQHIEIVPKVAGTWSSVNTSLMGTYTYIHPTASLLDTTFAQRIAEDNFFSSLGIPGVVVRREDSGFPSTWLPIFSTWFPLTYASFESGAGKMRSLVSSLLNVLIYT